MICVIICSGSSCLVYLYCGHFKDDLFMLIRYLGDKIAYGVCTCVVEVRDRMGDSCLICSA